MRASFLTRSASLARGPAAARIDFFACLTQRLPLQRVAPRAAAGFWLQLQRQRLESKHRSFVLSQNLKKAGAPGLFQSSVSCSHLRSGAGPSPARPKIVDGAHVVEQRSARDGTLVWEADLGDP